MSADVHASWNKSFINRGQVRVLLLSSLTSNDGLNQHYNCRNSVMVEQGIYHSMEYQTWLCVQRIGQQQTEPTNRFVYLTTINRLIGNSRWIEPSQMQYALGVLQKAAREDIDPDAD
jgi:hypothetical protein